MNYIEKIGKNTVEKICEEKLPCCSSTSNLFFSTVNSPIMEAIRFMVVFLVVASIVGEHKSLWSRAIATSNFRISSKISSRVAILSQLSPICRKFEVQECEIWFPKCEGNAQKTMLSPVIPSETDTNVKFDENNWPFGDSVEIKSKSRKQPGVLKLVETDSELNNRDRNSKLCAKRWSETATPTSKYK